MHHGVKGMHWGVRRSPDQLGHRPSSDKKALKDQKKFEKKVKKNWYKSYNKATKEFNQEINVINDKYTGQDLGVGFQTKAGQRYIKEVSNTWDRLYTKALVDDFGREPITKGEEWVKRAPMMGQYADYINRK